MIKVLFFIHDLGPGGAEKVLVNLVNSMDHEQFEITVMTLFGGGVNEQFLPPDIRYISIFQTIRRGHIHMMKLLSPYMLHKKYIKDKYDIEVAYLEGPSARVISGCPDPETKLVSWIHVEQHDRKTADQAFRSFEEAVGCYKRFDSIVCVSQTVQDDFLSLYPDIHNSIVLYNTNDTDRILRLKDESVDLDIFRNDEIKLCGVGKLTPNKGFDKICRIHKRLRADGLPVHTYILGEGEQRKQLEEYIAQNGLETTITLLGYQSNPYKYLAKCDVFVCASIAEGFSTAATEALILGTPVVTTLVSGMKEMLGENNEYGIVTENNEESLYQALKQMCENRDLIEEYRKRAFERGKSFSSNKTTSAVEKHLISLIKQK